MGQAKNSKKKMDNQEPVKKDDEAKRLEREIEAVSYTHLTLPTILLV